MSDLKQPTLAKTLYTAADLQGKESQCTPAELSELGDIAAETARQRDELLKAAESVLASVPFLEYRGDGELEECEQRIRTAIARAKGE